MENSNLERLRQPIVTICGHVDHGKCVSGDTLFVLGNGDITNAKQIFEENFDSDKAERVTDGVFQDISDKGIKISSFDGEKIIEKKISYIWRREANKLIEVKISSGDIIKTTPEHRFLVFYNEGIYEKRANELSESDYVAFPKHIITSDTSISELIIERIKKLENFVCFVNSKFDLLFGNLSKDGYNNIERKLSLKNLSLNVKKRRLRIKDLFLIGNYLGIFDKDIYSVISSIKNSNDKQRAGHTSKEISLPSTEDPEALGYTLGCLAGDGHLTKTNAILNNNDKDVQEAYRNALKKVFGVESRIEKGHTCYIVRDNCGRTLVRILSEVFDIFVGNKSGKIRVPYIAKKNKEVFRGFFAGLFDTDGYVSNSSIELTSKSKELIKECSALLLNFGILSSFHEKNGFYYLRISNKEYLKAFLDNIRPRLERRLERAIKLYEKAQASRIFDILPINKQGLKNLKFPGKKNKVIPYFDKYLKNQQITREFAFKILRNVKEESDFTHKLKKLLEKEIRLVKIISKKEIENKEKYVYDFSVPETKNFIAERMIVHNTSILDKFRGTDVQAGEAGGITQKISFTKYPVSQICKTCSLIEESGVKLEIPGFLFIDTPGHSAFTNLRKRGGSLADLAVLVVSIKEGIKPQTAEVLQILKANKTPFVIALNKIDTISGWQKYNSVKESIENQAIHVRQEFDQALLQFQASLQEHGFESELFYEVSDFTKKIALVPCSAKTGEGISELLFVLCGLCQKFLKSRLKMNKEAKGVILELKKNKAQEWHEAILYDGTLDVGDEIVIASFNEPIIAKVRTIAEIVPLSHRFNPVNSVSAATGVKMQFSSSENVLPGMPFQEVKSENELEQVKKEFKKEISRALELDAQGIIIKADSLGSLEALIVLLKQEKIQILKAGIGPIGKADLSAAKANLETAPLNAIVLGFNVSLDSDIEAISGVKILTNEVVYKLIEDISAWRKERQDSILKEKLMGLATICKLEILPQYVFRNSAPAVFGIRVSAGKIKTGIPLIDENGEEVAHVKSLQQEKATIDSALESQELAIALSGIAFDRRLKDIKYLYADISEKQFKEFKKNKDILSANELKVLQEIADIKRKKNEEWGS